jgi:monomeric sarcosine oxidase
MRPSDQIYDACVIGAGAFGAWTAYHLLLAGHRVALLDAYGAAHARSSSGGESRIIRMGYGNDRIYTMSAARSLLLWREFFDRTREPLFHRTGVLWIAAPDDPYALSTRHTLAECGVNYELLNTAELNVRYSQIQFPRGAWGIFEIQSGVLTARRAVAAVVADAKRGGVDYMDASVAAPLGGGTLELLRTNNGAQIRARHFVFACGPWLPKLFPNLLGKRIESTRQEIFFFGIPAGDRHFCPPALPAWIDFSDPRGPYGVPDLEGRGLKLAFDRHGPAMDPDNTERIPSAEGLAAARDFLGERFPALRKAPLVEARVCQYENTSNGDFLIDRHPDFSNVWLVGGGSGHGFKHGPAVGEYTAEHVMTGAPVDVRYSLATKTETPCRTVF